MGIGRVLCWGKSWEKGTSCLCLEFWTKKVLFKNLKSSKHPFLPNARAKQTASLAIKTVTPKESISIILHSAFTPSLKHSKTTCQFGSQNHSHHLTKWMSTLKMLKWCPITAAFRVYGAMTSKKQKGVISVDVSFCWQPASCEKYWQRSQWRQARSEQFVFTNQLTVFDKPLGSSDVWWY